MTISPKEFSEWVEHHRNIFYHEARRYLSDWDDREDAAQAATIKLWELCLAGKVHVPAASAATVTKYTCLSMLRTRYNHGDISYDQYEHITDQLYVPPRILDQDFDDTDWFNSMSNEDQEFARLLYAGHSEREIANMIGVTRSSIRSHKERIRRKLNATLQDRHNRPLPNR